MQQIKIHTLTGNELTVTYFDDRPFSVSSTRPISARDELELLCRNDGLGNFILKELNPAGKKKSPVLGTPATKAELSALKVAVAEVMATGVNRPESPRGSIS
jgi:hypothetical protein